MNVRSDSVITDISDKTGQRILRATLAGERDPERLAALRNTRVRSSVEMIAASLAGTWRDGPEWTPAWRSPQPHANSPA
ncbi:MAG: hypothetical protein OXI81_15880 [Paracoccaceae bacterium]|nr:hypothetical protein [Paracoccaceae bacterium]MDE2911949.1 hypothetical protein [Paracoccaceae bacterium]